MQRRPRRYTALPPRAGKSVLSADFDECSRKHRSATCLLKPSLGSCLPIDSKLSSCDRLAYWYRTMAETAT